MRKLDKNEALKCFGGAGITAAFVTAVVSLVTFTYNIGQEVGFTLKRLLGRC